MGVATMTGTYRGQERIAIAPSDKQDRDPVYSTLSHSKFEGQVMIFGGVDVVHIAKNYCQWRTTI